MPKGGMQERRDVGNEGWRKGGIPERWDLRGRGCRKEGIQEMRDAKLGFVHIWGELVCRHLVSSLFYKTTAPVFLKFMTVYCISV